MKKSVFILYVFLSFIAAVIDAGALVLINKIEISPLNRAVLSFNELPEQAIVKFSDDKRKITISIPGADFGEKVTDAHGSGIIQEVFVQLYDDTLTISAILKEPRGYTLARLPYSRKIILETFKWDQLSPDEDNLRLGLISLFDRIYPAAKNYLEAASAMNNIESKAYLGILLLRSGQIAEAEKYLVQSLKIADNFPDIYAALSQIYQIKGDSKQAAKYAKLFTAKTGMGSFDNLETGLQIADNEDSGEPGSLLNTIDKPDSIITDSVKSDSLLQASAETDTNALPAGASAPGEKSVLPEWLSSVFIYVIVFGGIIFVIILSSYIKWRKLKINKISSAKGRKFGDKLQKAGKNIKSEKLRDLDSKGATATRASDAYKKAAQARGEKTITEQTSDSSSEPNVSMSEKLERIAKEISKNRIDIEDSALKETPKTPVSAKLQLALHLQEEQNRLKNKSKADFESSGFTADSKKLAEIADKLGIEKDKVAKTERVPKISNDKESLSKLAEKFKSGKKE